MQGDTHVIGRRLVVEGELPAAFVGDEGHDGRGLRGFHEAGILTEGKHGPGITPRRAPVTAPAPPRLDDPVDGLVALGGTGVDIHESEEAVLFIVEYALQSHPSRLEEKVLLLLQYSINCLQLNINWTYRYVF